ncbi:hypothetical protein ACHAWX_002966 [Stephanocyclus meneghinianus]
MSPTKRRSRESIGSRTRSKRPAMSNVDLPVGGRKKRTPSSTTSGGRTSKVSSNNSVSSANTEAVDPDVVAGVDKSGKRRRVAPVFCGEASSSSRGVANNDVPDIQQATSVTPTAPVSSSKSPKFTKFVFSNANTAKPCNDTPRNQQPTLRHRNVTPLTAIPQGQPPAFPTAWQGRSHPQNNDHPKPKGVIDINLLPHACCLHSLQIHDGYSWLSSNARCICQLDSDHNSSECLSECYYGHYEERWQKDGWSAERWWLENKMQSHKDGKEKVVDEALIEKHLDYMPRQPHLNPNMRAILMDWLVEMSMEYGLHCETMYLSVMMVDRALACGGNDIMDGGKKGDMLVEKDKLQCVGCACTLIASKLLEITPPTVKDFRYISDNSYTAKEILKCEAKICSVLKFNFNFTTPYEYVDRYLRASFASPLGRATNTALKQMMERMVFYFLDLSLLDYKFVLVKPCLVAAAAVYLARATLGIREGTWNTSPPSLFGESFERSSQGFWTKTLEYYTGYDKWDLEEHVKSLRRLHEKAENSHLKSVYSKFKSEEFGGVALKTVLNEEVLGFF